MLAPPIVITALLLSLALSTVWPLAALAIVRAGQSRPPKDARFDVIVVLGCRVLPDGTPSEGLARRVALGAELHRAGAAPVVVLSGGKVLGPIAEARAALPALLDGGVPESSALLEDRSRSTSENARFTRALVGDKRVLVVTHAYHAPRARILFRREFREVESAGAASRLELRSALREVPLFVLTWLGVV
jgi:uncharacterized SAM-binding protein YcdF (DUF218 family)